MRQGLLALVCLILAAPCFGQAAQAEISQHDAAASFKSSSNLVQVPVIVRDKQGRPVGNLTKDDFSLFDKGKPQIISKFVVEKAGTPYIPTVGGTQAAAASIPTAAPFDEGRSSAPPIPERFVAYLFDDVHMDTGELALLRNAALAHIGKTLDPVTRIAIATTSGAGTLDFTDDLVKINSAINAILPYTRAPLTNDDCPNLTLYMADQIVNKNDPTATAVAVSDAQACNSGVSAQLIQEMIRTIAIRALYVGEDESTLSLNALKNLTKRMSAAPGSRNIVLISSGFLLPGDDLHPALTALLDQAIHDNVTINTLDARGVYTVIPGGNAETRTVSTQNIAMRTSYQLSEALANQDILEELASGTGGGFFRNDNGFAEGLAQLTRQPEFAYLLGFSPSDLKYDGLYHGVKVTLKNPANLTLQARRGYYAPKRPNDPGEAAKEDIREAVFSRDELQDIPIAMRLQFFKSSATQARLTVTSHVDVKNLHFQKAGEEGDVRSKDTLVIVAGLFDHNGNFVSGTQRTIDMNLRDQTLTTLNGSGINIPAYFEVTPGAYTIRVVVRDALGQMMAAKNGVVQIP